MAGTANPDDPPSRGRLCPRGTGGVGAHFDADRLRAPLLRASVRGEEKWTEVTWDEALGRVAEKMQKIKAEHGPEAIALFSHGCLLASRQHHAGLPEAGTKPRIFYLESRE